MWCCIPCFQFSTIWFNEKKKGFPYLLHHSNVTWINDWHFKTLASNRRVIGKWSILIAFFRSLFFFFFFCSFFVVVVLWCQVKTSTKSTFLKVNFKDCPGGPVVKKVYQSLSHVWVFATQWTVAHQAPLSMGFPRQDYGVGSHSLPQGIFSTQGSNPGLLYWRQLLYPLSHQGSPTTSNAEDTRDPTWLRAIMSQLESLQMVTV